MTPHLLQNYGLSHFWYHTRNSMNLCLSFPSLDSLPTMLKVYSIASDSPFPNTIYCGHASGPWSLLISGPWRPFCSSVILAQASLLWKPSVSCAQGCTLPFSLQCLCLLPTYFRVCSHNPAIICMSVSLRCNYLEGGKHVYFPTPSCFWNIA